MKPGRHDIDCVSRVKVALKPTGWRLPVGLGFTGKGNEMGAVTALAVVLERDPKGPKKRRYWLRCSYCPFCGASLMESKE